MWSTFLTNLFGIILGITLTFGVNALWQKHEENKNMKEMLTLIRNELEVNKKMFEDQKEILQSHVYYYNKILEINKKWETIPEDSIDNYLDLASVYLPKFQTHAWQIFQNSEVSKRLSS